MALIELGVSGQVPRACSGAWETCVPDVSILLNAGLILARKVLAQFISRAIVRCWQTLPGTYQYQGLKMIIHQSPGAEIRAGVTRDPNIVSA